MRTPGLKLLRQSATWLASRRVGHALILGYHRVADHPAGPGDLGVSPKHFAEQLDVLCQWAHPVSLDEVVRGLEHGELPRRAVAITFDDGYRDVLLNARPILERWNIPATTFVTTGYLGQECWWDELDRLLAQAEASPGKIGLAIQGSTHSWEWSGVDRVEGRRSSRRGKHDVSTAIYQLLLPLAAEAREHAMSELRSQTGAGKEETTLARIMTGEELSKLAEGGLVEIGAHSVTHPVLTALSIQGQDAEIRQSKRYLEELLGRQVNAFSYPNGSFSDHTTSLVRDAGYSYACASFNNVVSNGSDRFALPRFWVKDWDGDRFARWLRFWL